jgi:predicted DNA-binding WGR domain protein
MRMNFGPINQSGGEKRLNVAFSRAKHHMAVVSSIRHTAITNDYNDGANCLKSYLQYAAACSAGDLAASQRILRELALWRDVEEQETAAAGIVVQQIAAALKKHGYAVDTGVGMSHFRCDLAARRHGEHGYRIGVLVDTDLYYQQTDLLEREMLRPQLLGAFGWQIVHVLTRDWYHERQAVLDRLIQLIEKGPAVPAQDIPEEEDDDEAWAEFDSADEEAPETSKPAAPNQTPTPETIAPAPTGTRYFEFVGGGSSKFWEISVEGNAVTVRFGRIGTRGQSQTKRFADPQTADHSARRLVAEKTHKGYKEQR